MDSGGACSCASMFYCQITGSQNGQGWKGCLEVSGPKSLLREGHLKMAAQEYVHLAFEHLQGDTFITGTFLFMLLLEAKLYNSVTSS